jgi:hypothetical protein
MDLLHLAIGLVTAFIIIALAAALIVGVTPARYVHHAHWPVRTPLHPARPMERHVRFAWAATLDPQTDPAPQHFAAISAITASGPQAVGAHRHSSTGREGHGRQHRA